MNKKQVLIMDEEYWSIEPVIDRIQSVFGLESYVYCADGSEGLKAFNKENHCCIILDIMFPLGSDLDTNDESSQLIKGGLIILKRLRDIEKTNVPIICFTIRDDDDVKNEISKFTNTFHISKLNARALDLLIAQLRKYLR